ncbi:PREDICTED: CDL15_Pgr006012 [Prunus dulcis]|uniref:PREDICTED: CDL15_Pgr006012 n=1 Tax=Prunus dulcis TaxID=3755 RepID=A0A5E4GIC6_PRUDU|nr:PREDICTED: CDL15_Pgr006012 [Prunus dulcis]
MNIKYKLPKWPKPNRHRDAIPTAFTMIATSVANAARSVANATISSVTVTSVTTTTTAASTRLGVMAVEVLAVYAFDRVPYSLLVVESDKAEAPGPLDLTVVDDL